MPAGNISDEFVCRKGNDLFRSEASRGIRRGITLQTRSVIPQPPPTAPVPPLNARSYRRPPPYQPDPPRALAPGPQSGKRHAGRRVSIRQNALVKLASSDRKAVGNRSLVDGRRTELLCGDLACGDSASSQVEAACLYVVES